MSIILKKDTYKLHFDRKMAIFTMILVGLTITMLIVANVYWINTYDIKEVEKIVISSGKKPTIDNMNAYVKFRAIFTIIGNTLVMGLFMIILWMGISKFRLGLGFGVFWVILFISNAISTPFYTVQSDAFAIIVGILNGIIGISVLIWLSQLISYRQRLRQELANKRR
ncbi:hypothetical protein MYMA111404_01985 [Mycoplasma marinum]|uniref:Uncharacterized protein n=1 Tax=Mycoplasma marinum TaxID=1937190 RepID=A0A4R0XSQ9_9MOLU|nr:hypothetical protein [Mycoplasma marinum]TCG11921.1 hypothetical protein C4B24_00800 [Mycoplasma marinum]